MIYIVGSINLDYVARLEALPLPGETVLGSSLVKSPGGKGANQAVAAQRAGAPVRMIACSGRDLDGELATKFLAQDGVDLSGVERTEMPTGIAIIEIDAKGENSIAVLPGANEAVSSEMVKKYLQGLNNSDLVVLQQEIPQEATLTALCMAKQAGAMSILNVAPVLADSGDAVAQADLIIVNETEFEKIADLEASSNAADQWCQQTGKALALTLGADGAILAGVGESSHIRPPAIDPVDTVGAGDTFCGYLAAGLHNELSYKDAVETAVVASAKACLASGAQEAMPWAKDIEF